jgi:hypothetical protein
MGFRRPAETSIRRMRFVAPTIYFYFTRACLALEPLSASVTSHSKETLG